LNTTPVRLEAARPLARRAVACVVATCCGGAFAQGLDGSGSQAAARLEVAGQPQARLDNLPPDTRLEAVGWAGHGTSAFGVALGSTLERAELPGRQADQPQASLDVGVRWRSVVGQRQRVDVAAWRDLSADVDQRPAVTTRIEMQFSSPRTKGFAELGAVGMQLNGHSRLTLKVRRGKPMFYYRSKF
jgi:hypothetical protein